MKYTYILLQRFLATSCALAFVGSDFSAASGGEIDVTAVELRLKLLPQRELVVQLDADGKIGEFKLKLGDKEIALAKPELSGIVDADLQTARVSQIVRDGSSVRIEEEPVSIIVSMNFGPAIEQNDGSEVKSHVRFEFMNGKYFCRKIAIPSSGDDKWTQYQKFPDKDEVEVASFRGPTHPWSDRSKKH